MIKHKSVTLKPGIYIAGDPCYVMDKDLYEEMIVLLDGDAPSTYEYNGHTVAVIWAEDCDYEFGVKRLCHDSSLIGLVPIELCDEDILLEDDDYCVMNFPSAMNVTLFAHGKDRYGKSSSQIALAGDIVGVYGFLHTIAPVDYRKEFDDRLDALEKELL